MESLAEDIDELIQRERDQLRTLALGRAIPDAEFPLTATDQIDAILRKAGRTIDRAIQTKDHEIARRLLVDLIDHLLRPWQRAVADADSQLRREARPVHGDSVLKIWPAGDVPGEIPNVPDYLRPSKVEFLLDEVDRFPQDFEKVVDRSVTGLSGGAAVQQAVREVASGVNLGKQSDLPQNLPVAEYRMPWGPEWEPARQPRQGRSSAQVVLHLSLPDIRLRARDWLHDSEKPVGRHLSTTMYTYLTDPEASQAERADRRDRLLGQFRAMVKASLPLVAVEPGMAQLIHGYAQPPYNLHMTALNVPSELAPDLADIALAVLNSPQSVPVTTTPRPDAMMMTLLSEPYHMVEIASVMEPIVNQWSQHALAMKDFWLWRRTRPPAGVGSSQPGRP
ncbi:MAG: hypothetical protein LKI24_11145 [Acidipropionibacterium sp.]|nr:hypothetical protein [Acidipropionibacterium sp.]